MNQHFKRILLFAIALMSQFVTISFACTCIGKDKQTIEKELNFVDLAVKGKIIDVADFEYYDTTSYSLAGIKFDLKQSSYLVRKYKSYKLVVQSKFKANYVTSDTIQILTGYGSGDCGFEFEIGKEYIIYGLPWKEKSILIRQRKKKQKRKIIENTISNKFYTDICRLTQIANSDELEKLKKLTE
ncbi:MAG: hypothetical protein JNM51_03490 [Bacteroidia bacterium]|nr:hypothetical protein [Bacteroidia bacterium]